MTMHMRLVRLATAAALVLDVWALAYAMRGEPWTHLIGVAVHLTGAVVVGRLIHKLEPGRADGVLMWFALLFVPVFGPMLAFGFRGPDTGDALLKTEATLEEYDAWVHFRETPHRPSPFKGEFDRDFVTFAHVESHGVVLRSGTVAQKREVLRRLVDSERPELLHMARSALTDDDPEVRLLAYAELQRLEVRLYKEIDAARQWAFDAPDDGPAQAAPIYAHRRLAASGVLDDAMAEWHSHEAQRLERLLEGRGDGESITEVGEAIADDPRMGNVAESHLAEAAFRERNLDYVRAWRRKLEREARIVPEWVLAVGESDEPDIGIIDLDLDAGGRDPTAVEETPSTEEKDVEEKDAA